MPEYIEREALAENLKQFAPEHYTALIDQLIRKQPAADVVAVVHGRWDKNHPEDNIVYCDQCYMPQDMPTPFCHNCGAKMDGGDNHA